MTEVLSEHNIAKAERLLTDRKVTLTHVSRDLVKATVKGDTGTRFVVADKRPLTDTPGSDSQPSQAPAAARRKRSDANTSYLRLRIPDGARENGRETLETLIGEARDLIGRPEWSDPYYVLVEVLAVFVRDAHKEPAGV